MTIIENDEKPRTRVKAGSSATAPPATSRMPTVVEQQPAMMNTIDRAIAAGLTGADLQSIMEVQERWEANQSRKLFDAAMAEAQGEIPTIIKNRRVSYPGKDNKPATTYMHEDLAGIATVVKPILKRHGLAYRFRTEQLDGGQIRVTCVLTGYGHREENSLTSSRDESGGKNNIQAVASTCTYLERHTLKAALALASAVDDDGRASEDTNGISGEQIAQLYALINERGVNEARWLAHIGVETIEQIKPASFETALATLQNYRAVKSS